MISKNLAEKPQNYDLTDEVKASTVMTETEVQETVASNINDNMEGPQTPPKGGSTDVDAEDVADSQLKDGETKPLTFEDIISKNQLSPDMLANIVQSAKNDNLFPAYNLNKEELMTTVNNLRSWVDSEKSFLDSAPFSVEYYRDRKAVLQSRAAYVLILECFIGEQLLAIPKKNGTNENSECRTAGEERTKSQIIAEDYGLSPRLARDFQHLTWDGVKAAIELALRQNDIPTRALALSKSATIKAKQKQ